MYDTPPQTMGQWDSAAKTNRGPKMRANPDVGQKARMNRGKSATHRPYADAASSTASPLRKTCRTPSNQNGLESVHKPAPPLPEQF